MKKSYFFSSQKRKFAVLQSGCLNAKRSALKHEPRFEVFPEIPLIWWGLK
jgi:hypothetical protein